jgi:pilus assembly protein Flp/PilA
MADKQPRPIPATGRHPHTKEQQDVTTLFCYIQSFFITRFKNDERGASLVEYALLVALIAVVCIGAISMLGGAAKTKFSTVGSQLG